MSSEPRLVEVRRNILKHNDVVAQALRERFRDAQVFVTSVVFMSTLLSPFTLTPLIAYLQFR